MLKSVLHITVVILFLREPFCKNQFFCSRYKKFLIHYIELMLLKTLKKLLQFR